MGNREIKEEIIEYEIRENEIIDDRIVKFLKDFNNDKNKLPKLELKTILQNNINLCLNEITLLSKKSCKKDYKKNYLNINVILNMKIKKIKKILKK